MSGRAFEDAGPRFAEQDAFVPPLLPVHVQFHGPVPDTEVGIPTLQSIFVGMVFMDNRITVRFAYEWHDDAGNWFRSYGNENREFAENGLMHRRFASINDKPIAAVDRKYHWPQGRRPDDHLGLSALGL